MLVYTAINKVQAALAVDGIKKDKTNTQGASYKFRGIDDVFNALAPLLAKHQLCILPRILTRECAERQSKNGGNLFYVTVDAEFDFVSTEDGSRHTVKTFGEAMDSGDKATNKAMSAAYKYAALQAFAIPTEGDNDADGNSHEVASNTLKSLTKPPKESTNEQIENLYQLCLIEAKKGGKNAFGKFWKNADPIIKALVKKDVKKMQEIELSCNAWNETMASQA